MADYTDIKREININLPTNDEQEITAEILRRTLYDIIDEINDTKEDVGDISVDFKGVADYDTNPERVENAYYIAVKAGHYTIFNLDVDEGEIATFTFTNIWTKKSYPFDVADGSIDYDKLDDVLQERVAGAIDSSEIADDLTTDNPDMVLSAKQGKALKGLIDNIDTELEEKQDTLIAGQNITISNNIISAAGTEYTAGTGINIQNDTISAEIDNTFTSTATDHALSAAKGKELYDEVQAIEAVQDVKKVFATHADLDGTGLSANDQVKVLADETQDDATTIYTYNGSTFDYVGKIGEYATKTEFETLTNELQEDEEVIANALYEHENKLLLKVGVEEQEFTDEEKEQARNNINAASTDEVVSAEDLITDEEVIANALYEHENRIVSLETGQSGGIPQDVRLPKMMVSSDNLIVSGNDIIGLTTDKNSVPCHYKYISKEMAFEDDGEIAYQGNSTINHPKKGFSFDFEKKHRFNDWIEMDSFHCKAYYTDWMHFRDICTNRIYEQIMQTREPNILRPFMAYNDFATPYKDIDMLADTNIKCHIDGFPVELYINDTYWGLYSINIKKNRNNYKLKKNNHNHIQLDPDNTYINNNFNWTKLEIRNPKGLKNMDGTDYDGDNPQEIQAGEVKTAITTFMNNLHGIRSTTTKEDFEDIFNMTEVIDDILLAYFVNSWDFGGKNTLYTTWDGGAHWSMLNYDNDATFGIAEGTNPTYPFGDEVYPYDYDTMAKKANTYCPWLVRLQTVYATELEARYAELRNQGIFTVDNVTNMFKEWMRQVGTDVYKDDTTRWSYPGLGNQRWNGVQRNFIDSLQRIHTYMTERLIYLDNKYNYNN